MAGFPWVKNPGGKRYRAELNGRTYELVRQNVAAGALRWKGYVTTSHGVTYVAAKGNSFEDVKKATEEWEGPKK